MHPYVRHAPRRELRRVVLVSLLRLLKLVQGFILGWREDVDLGRWLGHRLRKSVAERGWYLLIRYLIEIEGLDDDDWLFLVENVDGVVLVIDGDYLHELSCKRSKRLLLDLSPDLLQYVAGMWDDADIWRTLQLFSDLVDQACFLLLDQLNLRRRRVLLRVLVLV